MWWTFNQALRICLEWSSGAISFSTHLFELINYKILLKTNRIHSLLIESPRKFFWKTFLTFVDFGVLPLKNLVFRFTSRKSPSLHSIQSALQFKSTYFGQINKLLWKQYWNYRQCIFQTHKIKLIKHFAQKSFCLFEGAHVRPPNTLKKNR